MGNARNFSIKEKFARRPEGHTTVAGSGVSRLKELLQEDTFHTMLTLERRRAERSRKPFVLMLLDAHALFTKRVPEKLLRQLINSISTSTRETDLVGWYKHGGVVGVIFTEVNLNEKTPITQLLLTKIVKSLHHHLDLQLASKVVVTLHLYPENWSEGSTIADTKLYPEIVQKDPRKRISLIVKRAIDIAGSALLLLLLSPLFALISAAIKITSDGAVLFEQDRLGQFGQRFKCLKFRTMYSNNDPKIHREYIESFIAGKAEQAKGSDATIYKITDDPRITPVGRVLRKFSLDELPQFWNVFVGEMSLVGPRPPVGYEFELYDIWHRRRVFELKPGVTGLWQVSGRSRTSFDDMVRLDLRYSQSWSIWLDIKILAATPRAVFTGDGAY